MIVEINTKMVLISTMIALVVILFTITIIINNRMLRLFHGVETFLQCGISDQSMV